MRYHTVKEIEEEFDRLNANVHMSDDPEIKNHWSKAYYSALDYINETQEGWDDLDLIENTLRISKYNATQSQDTKIIVFFKSELF